MFDIIELEDRHLTPETIAMYSLGGVGILTPTALSLLPFIFNNTPANVILKVYLPKVIMDDPTTETVLSSLYWLIHGFIAVIPVLQLVGIVILVFYESGLMLKPGYKPKVAVNTNSLHLFAKVSLRKEKGTRGNDAQEKAGPVAKDRLNKLKMTIQATVQFPSALLAYRKVALIYKSFQNFGFALFPSLILVAFLINVVCTFVCVRLNDSLPVVLVGMMGIIDVTIFINTIFVYGFALVITTDTQKFIDFWRWKVMRSIYKKQFQVCSVIQLWVGSFFAVHYSIVLEHLQQVVEITTNLLLM